MRAFVFALSFLLVSCAGDEPHGCPSGFADDAGACLPISGALAGTVALRGAADAGGVQVALAGTSWAAWTAADGSWRLDGVRPGRYAVEIRAQGWVPQRIDGVEVSGNRLRTLEPVALLRAEAAIRGTVSTTWAGDAPGTRIRLLGTGTEAVADGDGAFALVAREAGRFAVRVEHPGYAPLEIPDVELGWGDARDLGALHLRAETGGVSGAVSLADGGDPLGTVVYLAGTSHASAASAAGAFALERVVPGAYTLVAMREGYATVERQVTVAAAEVAPAGDVVLGRRAPVGVGRIEGIATVLGARDHAGSTVRLVGGPGVDRTATTGANGAWAFADVPAGVYAIEAAHAGLQPARVEGVVIAAGVVQAPGLVLKASRRVHEQALVAGAPIVGGSALLALSPALVRFDPGTEALATLLPEGAEVVTLHPAGEHAIVARAGAYFRLDLRDGSTTPILPEVAAPLAAAEGTLLYATATPGEVRLAGASATGSVRVFDDTCPLRAPLVAEPIEGAPPQLVRLTRDSICFPDAERFLVDLRNAAIVPAAAAMEPVGAGVLLHDADGSVRLYDAAAGTDDVVATGVLRELPLDVRYFSHGLQPGGVYEVTSLDPTTGVRAHVEGIVRDMPVFTGGRSQLLLTSASGDVQFLDGTTGTVTPFCAAARTLVAWGRGDIWCLDDEGALLRRSEAGVVSVAAQDGASQVQALGSGYVVVAWTHLGQRWVRSVADGAVHALGAGAQVVHATDDGSWAIVHRPVGAGRYELVLLDLAAGATEQAFFESSLSSAPDECGISPTARTAYCLFPGGTAPGGRLGVVFDRITGTTHAADAGAVETAALPPVWSPDERAAVRYFGASRLALRPAPGGPVLEVPGFAPAPSWAIGVSDGFERVLAGYPDGSVALIDARTGSTEPLQGSAAARIGTSRWLAGTEIVDLATGTRTPVGTGDLARIGFDDRSAAVVIDETGLAHWVGDSVQLLGAPARFVGPVDDGLLLLVDWNGRTGRLVEVRADGAVSTIAEDVTGPLAVGPHGEPLLGAGLDVDGRMELIEAGYDGVRSLGTGVPVGEPIVRFRDGWLFDARVEDADVLVHVADAGGSTVLGPRASWIEAGGDGSLEFAADGVWWLAAPGGAPAPIDLISADPRAHRVLTGGAVLYGTAAGGTWRADLP